MASGFTPNQCSMCQKNAGMCTCHGCKECFCIKHFNEHRQRLSTNFDADVVGKHDQLMEQVNELNQPNASRSEFFNEIDRWEAATVTKVHEAAERARHQLTELLHEEKETLTKEFQMITKEIHNRQKEDEFDENDIERLQVKLNQIQISLDRYMLPTNAKTIIVANDLIDWNQVIYAEKQDNRTGKY